MNQKTAVQKECGFGKDVPGKPQVVVLGLVLALMALACSTTQTTQEEASRQTNAPSPRVETSQESPKDSAMPAQFIHTASMEYAAGFNEQKPAQVLSHYHNTAALWLTNGSQLQGREAIGGFVHKGIEMGVSNMAFEPVGLTHVGETTYVHQSFQFQPAGGPVIKGKRWTVWNQDHEGWNIALDVWSPEADTSRVSDAIEQRMDALAHGFNGGSATDILSLYNNGARVVLTNGKVLAGDSLQGMMNTVADSGIDDMTFGPHTIASAGDTAWAWGDFSVTLRPKGTPPIPLQGHRITIWKQVENTWRITLEISSPR